MEKRRAETDVGKGVPRPNTFGRAMRITRTREFDRVFDGRRSSGDENMVVYAAPNGLAWPRIGILAGKRIGNAVGRNRVKRLIREAFRTSRDSLPGAFDLVVIARKETCNAGFDAIKSSLVNLAGEASAKWDG